MEQEILAIDKWEHPQKKQYKEPKLKCACLQKGCSTCWSRTHQRKYRIKLREQRKAGTDKRRNAAQAFIWGEKERLGCSRCGIKDFRCIDFHHLDKTTKKFTLGNPGCLTRSIKSLQEEINKCIAVCANCHRIIHHEERQKDKSAWTKSA